MNYPDFLFLIGGKNLEMEAITQLLTGHYGFHIVSHKPSIYFEIKLQNTNCQRNIECPYAMIHSTWDTS